MEGVMPISLGLTDSSARIIGAYVSDGLVTFVRPPLDSIDSRLKEMGGTLRLMTQEMVDALGQTRQARLRVQIMNEDLLAEIAISMAFAALSFLVLYEMLRLVTLMQWLDTRSHIHLHHIIGGLLLVWMTGLATVALLMAIYQLLLNGLRVFGVIDIKVTGGDFLDGLDLLKLLGLLALLALGLGAIVLFLAGVAWALSLFSWKSIAAAVAVGALIVSLVHLMKTLAGFDWEQLAKIGLGFAGILGFLALLGLTFRLFTTDLEPVVEQLDKFFDAIVELMQALAAFKDEDLKRIAKGFLAISVFTGALGLAFRAFREGIEKVVAALPAFFDAIARLMTVLAGFKDDELKRIARGFGAIALFTGALGLAFRAFKGSIDELVPGLEKFFTAIAKLMTALAGFKDEEMQRIKQGFLAIALFTGALGLAFRAFEDGIDELLPGLAKFFDAITKLLQALAAVEPEDMWKIGAGFLAIAGFVLLLGLAFGTFNQTALDASKNLGVFFTALTGLITLLANLTGEQFLKLIGGMLLILGFMAALAAILNTVAGPLASLATVIGGLGTVLEKVSALGGGLLDVLGSIGDLASDVGGAIGDFFGGVGDTIGDVLDFFGSPLDFSVLGGLPGTGPMTAALPGPGAAASVVPSPASALPGGLGPLAPGGALAAAAPGAPASVDQSVNVTGLTVTVQAERLEADSARLLTDDIVAQLQQKLGALRSTQDFRAGGLPAAPA